MNDHAQWRMNGEGYAIHQAVRHLDGADGEGADLDAVPGAHFVEIGVVEQAVFVEFVLDIGQCELRTPYGNIQFRENERQGADVVFVSMGENYAAYPLPVLGEVGNVGNHDIHAQKFGLGKHQAGVNDDNVVTPTHRHAVHSELAQAA